MANEERRIRRIVLALDSDTLGRGNEELGALLISNFLRNVAFQDPPETVVCYNKGVWLATEGSPGLPFLQAIAEKGADVISCGTCIDFFQLKDRLAVGRIGDMRGIVEALYSADKIIYT